MGSVSSRGVSVGVQYLGEGVSWTDVGVNDVGVKGVRDAKESVSREVSCEVVSRCSSRSGCFVRRRCSLNGGVSYKACHRRRAMSPCPVEYSCISGCSGISCSSSRAEASFGSVVSGPVGQWLAGRQDQSPCDRGSIVVCSRL